MKARTKRIIYLFLLYSGSTEEGANSWPKKISVKFKESSLYAAKHSHLEKKSKEWVGYEVWASEHTAEAQALWA